MKLKFLIVLSIIVAIGALAFETKRAHMERSTTEYRFTEAEVAHILKRWVIAHEIEKGDVGTVRFEDNLGAVVTLTWHGETVAGREAVGGLPLDFVWRSDVGVDHTNICLSFTLER